MILYSVNELSNSLFPRPHHWMSAVAHRNNIHSQENGISKRPRILKHLTDCKLGVVMIIVIKK